MVLADHDAVTSLQYKCLIEHLFEFLMTIKLSTGCIFSFLPSSKQDICQSLLWTIRMSLAVFLKYRRITIARNSEKLLMEVP